MTEKKNEIWTIEELVSLTETIQTDELEYNGKMIPLQWCELTESEEPKISIPADGADETQHYAELASLRMLEMIKKANKLNPDAKVLDEDETYKACI